MNTDTDNQLLAEYGRQGSEPAFRELVQRHVNMVYSAALRETRGNGPQAEDITQEVFTELARRAAKLESHPALAGWLYTCVRRMTANIRRADERRQHREQEVFSMNERLGSDSSEALWQQVRPVLDDVMHELNEDDRTAVVLRFFEGLSLKEVGAALGLTENAARMRVERALDKLHGQLSRRGIHSTAATLAAVLVTATVAGTSSAFASTVAQTAMTSAAAGPSVLAASKLLSPAKVLTAAAGALAVATTALILWHQSPKEPTAKVVMPATATAPAASASSVESAPAVTAAPTLPAAKPIVNPQMTLQLLDSDTGEPLAGAKLYLFYLRQDGRGTAVKAVTGADGRFGVKVPQSPFHALNLFVTADGHVPMVTSFGFRKQMPSSYTMKLEAGIVIGGQVVDETGQPIAGAKLEVDEPGNDMSKADNIQFGPDATITTDGNGQWSCNMIPKKFSSVSLKVTDKSHAETNVTIQVGAPDSNNPTITMPAGFSVSGLVQDSAGNPISGARIRQVRLNDEHEHSVTSDISGAFVMKNLAAGELMLAVQADRFAPAVQTIDLASNVASLGFQLGPGQVLRGRVVDQQGNPVAEAFVETTRRAVDKIQWSTNADANGRFEWDSAPTEPLIYSVQAEGFNRFSAQKLLADGSDHVITLTPQESKEDDFQITGTVTDAETGEPVDGFKVLVGDREPEWAFPLQFYTVGKDGIFNLSLPVKYSHPSYVVQIQQDGYLPAVSAEYARSNGNQQLEFKLQKGTGPSGVALLPGAEPAVNAAVLLCTPQAGVTLDGPAHVQTGINTTTYRTTTDNTGKFALPPAMEQQGVIVIHDQGYAEVSLADLATEGNVTLQAWGTIKGTLILDGQPVANAHITAFNQVLRYSAMGRNFGFLTYRFETTTDAGGNFSFDKLPPGQCSVFQQVDLAGHRFTTSYGTKVTIQAGTVTDVALGGTGQPVVGKAVLADTSSVDWQKVSVTLRSKSGSEPGPRPKRDDYATLEAYIAAFEAYRQAFLNEQHFACLCNSDGSFRLPNVPAGTYELAIEVRDSKQSSAEPHDISDPTPVVASLKQDVTVPGGADAQTLDLGTLQLAAQK